MCEQFFCQLILRQTVPSEVLRGYVGRGGEGLLWLLGVRDVSVMEGEEGSIGGVGLRGVCVGGCGGGGNGGGGVS